MMAHAGKTLILCWLNEAICFVFFRTCSLADPDQKVNLFVNKQTFFPPLSISCVRVQHVYMNQQAVNRAENANSMLECTGKTALQWDCITVGQRSRLASQSSRSLEVCGVECEETNRTGACLSSPSSAERAGEELLTLV